MPLVVAVSDTTCVAIAEELRSFASDAALNTRYALSPFLRVTSAAALEYVFSTLPAV